MTDIAAIDTQIRTVLKDHARLSKDALTLDVNDDLYQAGMTSHASVNLMLGLEDEFDIEFPERYLKRQTFESVDAIRCAVEELQSSAA